MSASSQDKNNLTISVTSALKFSPGDTTCISETKRQSLKGWKTRGRQMNLILDHFMGSISNMYETENQQLLDDLNNFIKSRSKGKLGYIPTAHVKLGMNVADNQLIADMIENSITTQCNALFVVRLSSDDCLAFSTIKSKIVQGLLDIGIGSDLDDEDDIIVESQLQDLSFPFLALARKQMVKDQRPIVVIMDDVENCGNKPGLDSFLISAQQCLENLSIVVILCCYTGSLTLPQLLPTLSCDTMYVSSFSPRCPRNIFQTLMNKVVLTPDLFTFKFSPKCLQLIVDSFVFLDISISRVSLIIKSSLFRHFQSSPFTMCFKTEDELTQALNSLSKKELNSLIKEISTLPSARCISTVTKEAILSRLKEIHLTHLNLLDISTYLYLMSKDMPGSRLASTVSGIFISFLGSKNYGQSDEVEDTIRSLGYLTFEELRLKLDICFNNGSRCDNSEFWYILNSERQILAGFKEEDIVTKTVKPVSLNELEPCKTRSEWKERMKKRIAETPKVLSNFEIWRTSFVSRIKKYLNQISSPYFMPLKELVYFEDVDYVIEHIFASSRGEVVHDLRNPTEAGKDRNVLVSKLHNMIQEGEAKFDVGDLLENLKVEREFDRKKVMNEETMINSFVTSINDLEFIGMIQKDKHKSEIYTKATWEMK